GAARGGRGRAAVGADRLVRRRAGRTGRTHRGGGSPVSPDGGLRIGVTAGRRGEELVGALTRLGARVVWGPTVAVVPASGSALEHQTAAVLATRPAWVVVTTAEGLDRWLAGIGPQRPAVVAALAGAGVAARGAKAAAACRRHGLRSVLTSPAERGVELARLVAARARPGDRGTVLADGNGSPAVRAELAAAGLAVDGVAPYRWTVPAAAGPEAGGCVPPGDLLRELCAGRLDAMAFTSPPAVDGLFAVAAALGIEPAVQAALGGTGTGDGRPGRLPAAAPHGGAGRGAGGRPAAGVVVRRSRAPDARRQHPDGDR